MAKSTGPPKCILAAAILLCTIAVPVSAQQSPPCQERAAVARFLTEKWHETLVQTGVGHTSDGKTFIVEFWRALSGTFSVVLSYPSGLSCLLISGDDLADTPPPRGSDL